MQNLPTTEQLRDELFKGIKKNGGVECQEYPDLYIAPDDIEPATIGSDYKFLKKVCGRCPVQMQCAEYAISFIPDHGVWGGMTPTEIRKIGRKRYPNARRPGRDYLGEWITTHRNTTRQAEESRGEPDFGPLHIPSSEGSRRRDRTAE